MLQVIAAGADQTPDLLYEHTLFSTWLLRCLAGDDRWYLYYFLYILYIHRLRGHRKRGRESKKPGKKLRVGISLVPFLVGSLAVAFALLFPLLTLARITSTAQLAEYTLVIQRSYTSIGGVVAANPHRCRFR